MRSARAIAACVGLALVVGACDPLDRRYFREGIGTELYTAELPEATRLQDLYVGYICHQAGLATIPSGEVLPLCAEPSPGPGWALFVQAGMNDIDRRCDAYLTWLDYRKKRTSAWQQQILNTATAADLILHASHVNPGTIGIVAVAFGLAAQTFTNLYSSLLLEVDQSTVQTVVLTRQNRYRKNLPVVIDNRPAAIYALRSYLRLCMPMTIETQINTTVKLFERGGTPALEQARANPMIDPQMVRTASGGTVVRTRFVADSPGDALTRYLYPNGVMAARDPIHERKILDFLAERNINVPILTFLRSAEHATQREVLARRLKLIP